MITYMVFGTAMCVLLIEVLLPCMPTFSGWSLREGVVGRVWSLVLSLGGSLLCGPQPWHVMQRGEEVIQNTYVSSPLHNT